MGKPFSQELAKLNDTFKWALNVPIENDALDEILKSPIFVLGSGGSSSACIFFSLLQFDRGYLATTFTPLDFQYAKNAVNQDSVVILISASGKNSDILFAFDTALRQEPKNIISFCLRKDTPLHQRSLKYSISNTFEFENSAGKDGFLATNSLIAYFVLIQRIYKKPTKITKLIPSKKYLSGVNNFCNLLYEDFTIIVLFGGWGKPVAIDIESKFSEAGLGNILFCDYRNFGHGRHNWFDKKKEQSAIVALITPEEVQLAERTLNLLPSTIPVLKIESQFESCDASLDLLFQSFYFVQEIGLIKKIDPGKPGVPDYGSKLYHLKYAKHYQQKTALDEKTFYAIRRKIGNINESDKNAILPFWIESYKEFVKKISITKFRGILLDYDGTLCASHERFSLLRDDIINYIKNLLENDILVAIITGRGKSVRENFQNQIPKKFWSNFVIGYYNGSQIGTLENNELPITESRDSLFQDIFETLSNDPFTSNVSEFELRKGQLTLQIKDKINSQIIKSSIIDILKNKYSFKIQILESSHSIDIISSTTSKGSIIDYCRNLLDNNKKDDKFLCIGDRGKYPGNDYQLLSTEYSLSVDQVSNDPYTCWNLSSIGNNCVETTLEYFNAIEPCGDGCFKIKL
jgi:hydroxymethylpyrimidine pyrophosphatase-like HAD family hydrolase